MGREEVVTLVTLVSLAFGKEWLKECNPLFHGSLHIAIRNNAITSFEAVFMVKLLSDDCL